MRPLGCAPVAQGRLRKRADFLWPEELFMAAVALVAVQWTFRGAWFGEGVPFLMSVGLGAITAVFAMLFARLLWRDEALLRLLWRDEALPLVRSCAAPALPPLASFAAWLTTPSTERAAAAPAEGAVAHVACLESLGRALAAAY